MTQLGFYIDLERCVGCRSCEASCDVTWGTPVDVAWRRVGTLEGGDYPDFKRFFVSMACNHCDVPVCAWVCPTRAYTKRESDGVVTVDPTKCIGCKLCIWACPYEAPQYDPARKVVSKCHFCSPRLAEGKAPRCVESCPYEALDYGPMDDLLRRHPGARRTAPGLPDPGMTRPNVLFHLPDELPGELRRIDFVQRLAETKEK